MVGTSRVVVGRALATHPTVLVAVTPTVGIDVAAKEALLNVIGAARDGGTAVLLVPMTWDLRICTRLLVMVKVDWSRSFVSRPGIGMSFRSLRSRVSSRPPREGNRHE
jgi:ABC-type uncharacterized transport system ATPase subunit